MGNPQRKNSTVWLFRLLGAGVLTCAFVYVPFHLYHRSGFAKYLQLKAEHTAIVTANQALLAEIANLQREATALQSDPLAVERVARHELGWVRPGDLLIDFSERAP
ncbi:MAG: septum formation initiator family protein [Deltaproteobacteria bacterium]|nr:septum formation initiator family protein [Deltaproteobacteria bacterium]